MWRWLKPKPIVVPRKPYEMWEVLEATALDNEVPDFAMTHGVNDTLKWIRITLYYDEEGNWRHPKDSPYKKKKGD